MNPVTLSFVGDISLNGIYEELLVRKGPRFAFINIKKELDEADLLVGNLESPLVPNEGKTEFLMKTPLKTNPEYIEGLTWAGFDIVDLSNIHIRYYSEIGGINTRRVPYLQKK